MKNQLSLESLTTRIERIESLVPPVENFSKDKIISSRFLIEIVKNMEQALDKVMLEDSLVGSSWMVLMMIYGAEDQKIIATDICGLLGQNKSTTSRIVDSLVNKNFLNCKEDSHDRRKTYLYITQQGKDYIHSRLNIHNNAYNQLFKDIDLSILLPLLNQILKNSYNLNHKETN